MSDTPAVKVRSSIEFPEHIVDDVASQLGDNASALAIRDACVDRLDRDTAFVTADGQPVEQVVRNRIE